MWYNNNGEGKLERERLPISNFSAILIFVVLAFVILMAIYKFSQPIKTEFFSDFREKLRSGEIQKVSINPQTNEVFYRLKGDKNAQTYRAKVVITEGLMQDIETYAPEYDSQAPSVWQSYMPSFTVLIVIIGLTFLIWMLFLRQAQNTGAQAFAFSKSRAKLLVDNKPKVTFNEVAGMDEAKEELKEVVDFLRSTEKFRRVGARIPKGVLLVGPPGCGKTLLARAVAGEASVPFLHISGSEFVELFVGVGASRVRDLFTTAEKNAPCVVFIDEIDAVGRQRGAGLGGGHDEREQTLNQLLVEMDGFNPNVGIVVLAATNRPDILDPALLRPGRFDRRVVIDRPDQKGRLEILKVHIRQVPLTPNVNLEHLAQRTPGFTGADLANMVNEAAILAARENKVKVEPRHFEEAIERVIAGPQRKSRIISDREKEIVAYHESGHAILGWILPHADQVHKISILPRGLALGYTLQLPEEDKYLMTRAELMDKMTVLIGGRVAEEITFHEISTGAQNDLEDLTELTRKMVKEFGMSDVLGPITYGKRYGSIFLGRDIATERDYSEETAQQIDEEVKRLIKFIHHRAKTLLEKYQDVLNRVAKRLIQVENLEKEEFEHLMKELEVPRNSDLFAYEPALESYIHEPSPE